MAPQPSVFQPERQESVRLHERAIPGKLIEKLTLHLFAFAGY